MSIITGDESPILPVQPPVIVAPEFKGITVDTKYIPRTALIARIEGAPWTVNYYSQVLDQDIGVQGQSLGTNPVNQQYILIQGMILKVGTALLHNQNPTNMSMNAPGNAMVYPFLIPNRGDMFVADVGDGRAGVFEVTASIKKTMFKESCHEIEYVFINFATDDLLGDLNQKIQNRLRYVDSFLQYGQNPLLQEEEFYQTQELTTAYHEIARMYFRAFVNRDLKALLLPNQPNPTYDDFLTAAVLWMFGSNDFPQIREIKRFNCMDQAAMWGSNVWLALKEGTYASMPYGFTRTGLVSNRCFTRNPVLEGVRWANVDWVVYPRDLSLESEVQPTRIALPVDQNPKDIPIFRPNAEGWTPEKLFAPQAGLPPLLHPVLDDDYYVFSEHFYHRTDQRSQLELQVDAFLTQKALSNQILLDLANSYVAWGNMERFYYTPVLLFLIKASIRSL